VFLETRTREMALSIASRCPETFGVHVAAGIDPSPLATTRGRIEARLGVPSEAGRYE
jgi:4-diphosphocytidyl-2-C-methyl-D-erythritol kinase